MDYFVVLNGRGVRKSFLWVTQCGQSTMPRLSYFQDCLLHFQERPRVFFPLDVS
jgi:hypothetical protein